jgi:hypothetical protein
MFKKLAIHSKEDWDNYVKLTELGTKFYSEKNYRKST